MNHNDYERFAEKVRPAGDCWIWTGGGTPNGYGMFWLDGRNRGAHRVSYEHHVGPLADGQHVDHLCRVRRCVNPAHLEAVTPAENLARSPITLSAINSAKTHCPSGHPYDRRNTYRPPGAPKTRQCRRCLRLPLLAET